MLIYFSGGGVKGVWRPVNTLLIEHEAARLLSFAYQRLLFDYCDLVEEETTCGTGDKRRVMIDSGAFTAWTKGEQVSLKDLISFVDRVLQRFSHVCEFVIINLDVIPGRKGVDPTKDQVDEAMKKSLENFEILQAKFPGLILPVFHQSEPKEYYDSLLTHSHYVCLSPRNDVAEKYRRDFAQEYTGYSDTHKFHGLAAMGIDMMEQARWYSVDSAAWIFVAGMGSIFCETARGFQPLAISDKSPRRRDEGAHITTRPEKERDEILTYISSRGFDPATLANDDVERYKWNALQWIDYQKRPHKGREIAREVLVP